MNYSLIIVSMVLLLWKPVNAGDTRLMSEQKLGSIDSSCIIDMGTGKAAVAISSDNFHIAYVVKDGQKMSVIRDSDREFPYDEVVGDSLVFSPDGKKLAYVARQFNKWCVVLDGIAGKQCESIKSNSIIFSPDSRRVAYAVKDILGWTVVVDDYQSKNYDDVREDSIVFSPDSRHVAYFACKFGYWFVVIDGSEGKNYGDLIPKSKIIWDSISTLHYLAVDSEMNIYIVREKIRQDRK